jgi:hypothetical protein
MQPVKIVEIGGEGGSICLYGRLDEGRWRFWRGTDETTLLDLGASESDGPFVSRSQVVDGWDDGVALLDHYGWAELYPVYVHPDFAERVIEAVAARSRNGRPGPNWLRACACGDPSLW